MSILVEFMISADRFELAQYINQIDTDSARIDRLVSSDDEIIIYAWVTAPQAELTELTSIFENSEHTTAVSLLERLETDTAGDHKQLYRLEWQVDDGDVLDGIIVSEGRILEGYSTDGYWFLRLRFSHHENVIQFYRYLTTHGISDFTIERVYELTDHLDRDETYDLTSEQRETLTLAAQRGYFSMPREVTLADLAEELDISQQAVSQRLRRATRSIVFAVLNLPEADTSG